MEILNNIEQLLKENKLKKSDLCEFLGVKKSTFSHWKAGENTSYKKYIAEIAEFFGVSVDYLLGRTNVREEKIKNTAPHIVKQSVFSFEGEGSSEQTLNIDQLDQLNKLVDAARELPPEKLATLIQVAEGMKL